MRERDGEQAPRPARAEGEAAEQPPLPSTAPPPPPPPASEPAEERRTLTLIAELQAGRVSGKNLSRDERRRCVEHMTEEGLAVPAIAEILKTSERTIARDRAAIRDANSLKADAALAGRFAGQLVTTGEAMMARLRRLGRERHTKPGDRIQAEIAAWGVERDRIKLLQSLGFLPMAGSRLSIDVTDAQADTLLDDLERELERVQAIAVDTDPPDGALITELKIARGEIKIARASQRVAEAAHRLDAKKTEKSDDAGPG